MIVYIYIMIFGKHSERGGEIDKIDDNSWPAQPAGYSIDDTVVVVPVFFILLF